MNELQSKLRELSQARVSDYHRVSGLQNELLERLERHFNIPIMLGEPELRKGYDPFYPIYLDGVELRGLVAPINLDEHIVVHGIDEIYQLFVTAITQTLVNNHIRQSERV